MTLQEFRQPAPIFRGTDFWMLNDRLSEEGIRFQLREMSRQGVHSVIARTYIGLKSDYPGPDYKSKMRVLLEAAGQEGMEVFLQAGYMPEAVVGLPRDWALRYILPVSEEEIRGRRLFCKRGRTCFVEENSETFLDLFDGEAVDYYLLKSYEEMWREFAPEFGKTIRSIWVDEPSYNGRRLPYTRRTEERFRERWGYSLERQLWKLFEDAAPGDPLTEGDAAEPADALPPETVRYHYRVLLRDLLEENYFRRVRKWCNDRGLWFSGHLMMEDTLTSQICRVGACMPYYKYFDLPGMDVLCAAMNWTDDPLHPSNELGLPYVRYITPLQCVSAARQLGQPHVLAEMYGVSTENLGFRGMLHLFDSYAALGISHRCVHGMFYSLRGRGKRAYPPHIHYYQPYWEKYRNVTDYCARVSAFISDGRTPGGLAVVHPLETAYTLYAGSLVADAVPEAGSIDKRFLALLQLLETMHREPELCDLATLRDWGQVRDGRLVVGQMDYGTLLLPDLQVLSGGLFALLREFAEGGGRLILLGQLPHLLDGWDCPGLGEDLAALPGAIQVPDLSALYRLLQEDTLPFTLTGGGSPSLLVNRRVCREETHFFLFNSDCAHPAPALLRVPGRHTVFRWDAETGDKAPFPARWSGSETEIPFTVDCGGSLLLSLEAATADTPLPEEPRERQRYVLPLETPWEILPREPNCLYLEYCRFATEGEDFSPLLPVIAVQRLLTQREYRGRLTLQFPLYSRDTLHDLTLALEEPTEQSLWLDDRRITAVPNGYYRDPAFEKLPLGALTAGAHCLTVKRDFRPLTRTRSAVTALFETQSGVELEPMYLLGDFTVHGIPEPSSNGCVVYGRDFTLRARGAAPLLTEGELTGAGYPFYAGVMSLVRSLDWKSADTPVFLQLGVLNAGAGAVWVNGSFAGDVNRAPGRVELTPYLHPGSNRLEIRLYPTLRNLTGPFHRPRGDVGNHFGGGYANPDAAWLSVDTTVPGWEEELSENTGNWTNSYNLTPFGIAAVSLVADRP